MNAWNMFILYISFGILAGTTIAQYLQHGCPITCSCTWKELRVNIFCQSGYWTSIPKMPPNTYSLSIKGSNIPILKNGSFLGSTSIPELVSLKLNHLIQVEQNAFQGLVHLKSLQLSRNKLSFFKNETFKDLKSMGFLFLNNNEFLEVPEQNICLLSKLQKLNLAANKINKPHFGECFRKLSHLAFVILSNNKLVGITKSTFENIGQIKMLCLDGCGFVTLPEDIFQSLPQLTYLSFAKNKLKYLSSYIFSRLKSLSNLNIKNNKFLNFSINWISSLELNMLQMSNIHMTHMPKKTGTKLVTVQRLILSGNRFGTLQRDAFHWIEKASLKILEMNECSIRHIGYDTFTGVNNLEMLILPNNPLNASSIAVIFKSLNCSKL